MSNSFMVVVCLILSTTFFCGSIYFNLRATSDLSLQVQEAKEATRMNSGAIDLLIKSDVKLWEISAILKTGLETSLEAVILNSASISMLTDLLGENDTVISDSQWMAICRVESQCDPRALNKRTGAAGIAQIKKICVRDINRILGYERYTYEDRYAILPSREMFVIYTDYYSDKTFKDRAMTWYGGPKKIKGSEAYWKRVNKILGEEA